MCTDCSGPRILDLTTQSRERYHFPMENDYHTFHSCCIWDATDVAMQGISQTAVGNTTYIAKDATDFCFLTWTQEPDVAHELLCAITCLKTRCKSFSYEGETDTCEKIQQCFSNGRHFGPKRRILVRGIVNECHSGNFILGKHKPCTLYSLRIIRIFSTGTTSIGGLRFHSSLFIIISAYKELAVDGLEGVWNCYHSEPLIQYAWWLVDLQANYKIKEVHILPEGSGAHYRWFKDIEVSFSSFLKETVTIKDTSKILRRVTHASWKLLPLLLYEILGRVNGDNH
ncbi:hypothetical protein SK128_017008 [Halocaridina rubra]|uniref:Uncharacterized protein n=1 Tax=Halocaridina rubra TaxID=373956 RepID=A0AAN9A8Q4_HALRR